MNENEIAHATDGALRVARRQYIQASLLAKKAHSRLELDEHGDESREGLYHNSISTVASGRLAVERIERELDHREADYCPRSEVEV